MDQKLPLFQDKPKPFNYRKWLGLGAVACLASYSILSTKHVAPEIDLCPALDKLVPEFDDKLSDLDYFKSSEYRNMSLNYWRDAIRIPTENFDDLGDVGEDPRWEIFNDFREYLIKTFPKTYSSSELHTVNTYGLVFDIKGSDSSLKPIMLGGHQDVVPVPKDGVSRWTHPPFDGFFDGDFLWGRGSSDCKNNVIAVFEAIEQLLTRGFQPKRSIVIALGFDEETSGHRGANSIKDFLKEKWGEKSMLMIVDEGGLGVQDLYGSRLALPSTGEKGYVDITIDLITTGGHSSVPPRHTGIGMMADFIHEMEADEFPLDLSPKSPFYYQLQCEAKASTTMSSSLKSDISRLTTSKAAKKRVLKEVSKAADRKALVSTTQAIDIIFGGLKINALPERVTLKTNHRISYDSSFEEVKEKTLKAIKKVAERYNLDIEAFGEVLKENEVSSGLFKINSDSPLVPAPLTPTINNPTWDVLGGTIKHVFEDFAEYRDGDNHKDITVSPSCMTGNTDTRYYWDLTDNIYRFTPIRQVERANAHAIDERVSLDAHIEGVVFFYQLIRNVDVLEQ